MNSQTLMNLQDMTWYMHCSSNEYKCTLQRIKMHLNLHFRLLFSRREPFVPRKSKEKIYISDDYVISRSWRWILVRSWALIRRCSHTLHFASFSIHEDTLFLENNKNKRSGVYFHLAKQNRIDKPLASRLKRGCCDCKIFVRTWTYQFKIWEWHHALFLWDSENIKSKLDQSLNFRLIIEEDKLHRAKKLL